MNMTMRRWTSLLLSISLVLVMAVYAFADEGEGGGGGDDSATSTSQTTTQSTTSTTSTTNTTGSSESTTTTTSTTGTTGSTESTTAPCTTHKWNSGTITANPTCAVEGTKIYTCSVCGTMKTETVKMLAHSYTNTCDGTCNECGANREVTHTAAQGWHKRSSGHYHKCKICGVEMDTGKHFPGPAATEDEDQICLTCGYVMTPKKGHVHSYQNTLVWDEEGHWYPCEKCEEKKDFTEHTFTGSCSAACSECGYEDIMAHIFDGELTGDAVEHWCTCSACGAIGPKEAHIMENGQLCLVCGVSADSVEETVSVQEETADHEHESASGWMKDDANHWQQCSCGEFYGRSAHTWNQGTEEDGAVTYVCQECGHNKVETVRVEREAPVILIVLAAVAVVCAIGAAVLLVYILKQPKGKFRS